MHAQHERQSVATSDSKLQAHLRRYVTPRIQKASRPANISQDPKLIACTGRI